MKWAFTAFLLNFLAATVEPSWPLLAHLLIFSAGGVFFYSVLRNEAVVRNAKH